MSGPRSPVRRPPGSIGIVFRGQLIVNQVVTPGKPLAIGHGPACDVMLPRELGIQQRLVLSDEDLIHLEDADVVNIVTELAGVELSLEGNVSDRTFGDYRKAHAGLSSPVRTVGARVAIRIPLMNGEVLLVLFKEERPRGP